MDKNGAEERVYDRLKDLLALQKAVEQEFGAEGYNVFVFGSYLTTRFEEGKSDIDIAIYADDFGLYKRLSLYLEEYFCEKQMESDIFFIDTTMEAPIYCAPLKSELQFTDYFPEELAEFQKKCQAKLEEAKARIAT